MPGDDPVPGRQAPTGNGAERDSDPQRAERGGEQWARSFTGLSARALALRGLVLAGFVGGMVALMIGLIPSSATRLAHARAEWIVIEVVLELGACASYAWLFHGVFSHGAYRITFLRSSQIGVGELGAFAVVPTGLGGPALRLWALRQDGMPLREMMVRSVIHAPILNLPYIAAALVLGITVVLGIGPGHAPVLTALAPIGVVLATVAVGGGATVYVRRHRDLPQDRWQRLSQEAVQTIPEGLREVPRRLRNPGLILAATGYWAGDCGVLVCAFHAAGGSAPLAVIVLAYMLGQLGNTLPLPGGVGGVEPLMLGVLTASGVNIGLAGAAIVLYRFVSLGLQAALGAAAVASLLLRVRSPS